MSEHKQLERKGFTQSIFDKNSILLLRKDAKLKSDGTEIYFVVDTFDIIDYCFPFYKTNDKNASVVSNRHIAYKYLFYQYENKPIIPDEYLKELCSFKYHLRSELKEGRAAIKAIEDFMSDKNINNLSDVIDFFLSNINIILALALDLLTPESINRFEDIITNRLDISEVNIKNVKDKECINDIFSDSKQSDVTNEIFNDFYEEIKYSLLSSKPTAEEKYRYLNNSYKDIIVIDRCIQVNQKIYQAHKQGKLKNKYLFLYVSSTPSKSEMLFALKSVKKNYPDLYGQPNFNILRNSPQLYLQSILNNKNRDYGRSFLDSLLDYSTEGQMLSEHGANIELLSEKIDDQLSATNEEVNINTKLHNFFSFKEQITSAFATNAIKSDIVLFRKIVGEVLYSKELEVKAKSCEEIINLNTKNYRTELTLLKLIKSLESNNFQITANSGKDIIKSNYQHLPILLFYNTKDDVFAKHWNEFVKLISNYLSHPSKNNVEVMDDFIKAFSAVLKVLKPEFNRPQSPFIVSIVFNYLQLIVPINSKDESKRLSHLDNEKAIIKDLESIRILFNNSFIKGKYNIKNNRLDVDKINHRYAKEIDYLLVWLHRRQTQYDEAKILADKNLKKYPNDPRFIHGKALAIYSQLYDNDSHNISDHKHVIDLILQAINLFEKEKEFELVRKTVIALKNTLCYIYTKLYKISFDIEHINNAERYLMETRKELGMTKLRFESFPAFCDTATNLYICKCEIAINNKNNDLAIKEYWYAKDYFSNCKNSWLYKRLGNEKKRLINILNELKAKIKFTNQH